MIDTYTLRLIIIGVQFLLFAYQGLCIYKSVKGTADTFEQIWAAAACIPVMILTAICVNL
jgi:hypothetical protein